MFLKKTPKSKGTYLAITESYYDKEKKVTYTNYCVFSFEAQNQQKAESSYAMEVDGESPFQNQYILPYNSVGESNFSYRKDKNGN